MIRHIVKLSYGIGLITGIIVSIVTQSKLQARPIESIIEILVCLIIGQIAQEIIIWLNDFVDYE